MVTARHATGSWCETDNNNVLGLHGRGYPSTGGYHFLAEMAESLFPETTTSCTVFGLGEKIAITQDLISPVDIGSGDVIQPQICWISSLNGRWTTSVYDLSTRLFWSEPVGWTATRQGEAHEEP